MAGKVRPVLVVSVPYSDQDYALVTVIPHTTSNRGAQFEVHVQIPFLQTGAFNVQGMLAVPFAKFIRRIGDLEANHLKQIEEAVKRWLGLL